MSLSIRWLAVFRIVVSYAYVSNIPTGKIDIRIKILKNDNTNSGLEISEFMHSMVFNDFRQDRRECNIAHHIVQDCVDEVIKRHQK